MWVYIEYHWYTMSLMGKKQTAFRIDEELIDAMRAYAERVGVPMPEQVRRAIRAWLESQGQKISGGRKPAKRR